MRKIAYSLIGLVVLGAPAVSFAAGVSALDTGALTLIADGFDSVKLTVLDIVAEVWPYMLAVIAILMAPKLVKRLAHSMT